MIKIKYFVIIIFLIILYGCKEPDTRKEITDSLSQDRPRIVPIQQKIFKGMYVSPETFTECSTYKKFIISPDGENKELEKAFASVYNKKPNHQFYIEAEGFSSTRERSKGKGFDTIFVITRFVKLDTARNCNK